MANRKNNKKRNQNHGMYKCGITATHHQTNRNGKIITYRTPVYHKIGQKE